MRAFTALLPRHYVWRTVIYWCKGEHAAPPEVLDAIAAEIRRRCAEGLAIADRLDAEAAERRAYVRPLTGFAAVDPMTGTDKRGNWRR